MSPLRVRTRLGPEFSKLWSASAVSNVGDGVTLAAGPLLVASLTDDPALVAGAVFVQQLPWLLFALLSGVVVDRWDRRRLIVAVNVARAAVLATLAVAVAANAANVPLLYVVFFLLGAGETLADSASAALLPSVVPPELLPRANGRLMAVFYAGNQFVAPPVGAWLFVSSAALPFGFDAATFAAAALILRWLRPVAGPPRSRPVRRSLRADLADGLRWLWLHPALRMLTWCLALMNVTFMAAFAAYVLYVRDRLGAGPVAFGALITAGAVGGLAGTLLAGRAEAALGAATLLRAGLVIETATHLVLAVTRSAWVAGVTLALFGAHAAVWGVVALSVRQRVVPDRLRGRVNSVYQLGSVGGAAVGALLGGLVARHGGLAAPYWLAFAGMLLLTVVAWPRFTPAAFATPDAR